MNACDELRTMAASDDVVAGLLEGLAESMSSDAVSAIVADLVDGTPLATSPPGEQCRRLFALVDWALHAAAPIGCDRVLRQLLGDVPIVSDSITVLAARVAMPSAGSRDGASADVCELVDELKSALESAVWADAAAAHDSGRAHPLAAMAASAARGHAFSSASDEEHLNAAAYSAGRAIGIALRSSGDDSRLRAALRPLVRGVVLLDTPALVATLSTLLRDRVYLTGAVDRWEVATWLTVYCTKSVAALSRPALLDGLLGRDPAAPAGVDYARLAKPFDFDDDRVREVVAALRVDGAIDGFEATDGFDTAFGVRYASVPGHRPLRLHRWTGARVAEEIREAIKRFAPSAPAIERLRATKEVIGIELGASQLGDFGIVIAHEAARYLAQVGDGIICDLDQHWVAVTKGEFAAR